MTTRRIFLQQSALVTTGLLARPFITRLPQTKYKAVLIGSGWWGLNILREGLRTGELSIAALCDVDQNQLKRCREEVDRLCNDRPKFYTDYRECLRTEKPDIAIIATPDHWHALPAIEALRGGAHVFLEKPIGHTVKEGTAIVKAARDAGRVCIVDFHRRYSPHNVSAHQFLKDGKAGAIHNVKAFVHYNWGKGAREADAPVPEGLDWNAYCGPAPLQPYHAGIHPRGFRQYMAFANGQIGDWGPHWFDQILWWTEEKMPRRIYSSWKKDLRESRTDAPELQTAVFEFESFTCTWEHSMLNAGPERNTENVGVYFYGTEGTFHLGWQKGWTFFPSDTKKEIIHVDPSLDEPDQQNIALVWKDMLDCIRNKKIPHADVQHGKYATDMALLANISAQTGRAIQWDADKDAIIGDKAASQKLTRTYRAPWRYPV